MSILEFVTFGKQIMMIIFRDEKVKDFTFADISKFLDIVLELVPWKEMSQSDFIRDADVRIKMSFISVPIIWLY